MKPVDGKDIDPSTFQAALTFRLEHDELVIAAIAKDDASPILVDCLARIYAIVRRELDNMEGCRPPGEPGIVN